MEHGKGSHLMTCEVVLPGPGGARCGAPATHRVHFTGEGGEACACHECSVLLAEVARSFGAHVAVEKLERPS